MSHRLVMRVERPSWQRSGKAVCTLGAGARAAHTCSYAALLAVAWGVSKPSAPSACRRLPSSRGALVATIVLLAYAEESPVFAAASCSRQEHGQQRNNSKDQKYDDSSALYERVSPRQLTSLSHTLTGKEHVYAS